MTRVLRKQWRWFVAGAAIALAFLLGWWGFEKQPPEPGQGRSLLDSAYRSIQLFRLEYGSTFEPTSWQLDAARLLAPAALLVTAASLLVAIFHERLRLRGLGRPKERVVICGLGRKGLLLARSFKARGCLVVAIEQDEKNTRIQTCRDEGMPVLVGDVTDPALLRRARAHRASYVVAVCGHDGVNADVAAHARELVGEDGSERGPLTIFAHIVDLDLCRLLRDELKPAETAAFRLELFNVFETGARTWLGEHPAFGSADEEPATRPHLVVVGAGQMGMSLVAGAARQWLTLHGAANRKPRLTIVDREAGRRRRSLLGRFPQLGHLCELVPVTTDVTWPEFERARFLRGKVGRPDVTAIYVCLDDDARGITAALQLVDQVDDDVPIVVRTAEAGGFAGVVQGFANVVTFQLLDRTCTPEMLLGESPAEVLARGIHEEYRRDALEAGRTPQNDPAVREWHELPEGLKESNRRQADHIAVKLRAVGCRQAPLSEDGAAPLAVSPEEIEMLAQMEHERWVGERLFEGWTYASAPKNIERKTSPALVPWEELPREEKEKDRATVRSLPAVLGRAGLGVTQTDRSRSLRRP